MENETAEKLKSFEEKIGPRGSAKIDYKSRALLRSWLQAKLDVPYSAIMGVSVPMMRDTYNDATDATFKSLATRIGVGSQSRMALPTSLPEATTKESQVPTETTKKSAESANTVAAAIAEALAKFTPDTLIDEARVREIAAELSVDESKVRAIAREEVAKLKQVERVVVLRDQGKDSEDRKDMGVQHRNFGLLLKIVEAGLNVALVGPAGTGKTTAAHKVSDALKLAYECQSFCATTTKSDLLGFIDANGHYRTTSFRRAYETGGVWTGDEFDAGNANAGVVLNAATANGVCSFPDGMIKRSASFRAIICMNTYGNGANRQYVGRNQMDAATMDRFVFLEWGTDEALEASFLGLTERQDKVKLDEGGIMTDSEWFERVRAVRAAVEKLAIRHLVTPRATIHGAKLFAAGLGRKHVEELVLWKGLDSEQRKRVEAAL